MLTTEKSSPKSRWQVPRESHRKVEDEDELADLYDLDAIVRDVFLFLGVVFKIL